MKSTLVYCILFVAAAMSVMLYYMATRTAGMPERVQEETVPSGQGKEATSDVPMKENEIAVDRTTQNTNYFCVPMPEEVKAETYFWRTTIWTGNCG